ncbi:MAG: hypothetical protein A2Z04_04605 [Chloroflexi bacterium RBG_16_57_9]|nr:MAG: hypothetical protein A2Z04_04605 [Chloroflexi bacterium RBG_16_57_9]
MREICTGPYPQDNPRSIAHLKGQHLCNYRYRLGERRILYEIDETQRQIHVIDFGPRGDIY